MFSGHNLTLPNPLVEIGLTELAKSGGMGVLAPVPPVTSVLSNYTELLVFTYLNIVGLQKSPKYFSPTNSQAKKWTNPPGP